MLLKDFLELEYPLELEFSERSLPNVLVFHRLRYLSWVSFRDRSVDREFSEPRLDSPERYPIAWILPGLTAVDALFRESLCPVEESVISECME